MRKLISKSTDSPPQLGTIGFRVVLYDVTENGHPRFATWLEATDKENPETFWGHYHTDLKSALREFHKRCLKENL